jgi:multidrug efflux pump subunit AcrA (membrane-fusion protein)
MPGHQASRFHWRAAAALSLATSLVVGLVGCAGTDRILVTGNVDDDLVTVQAPQLEISGPNLDAGFADAEARTSGQPTTSDQNLATNTPLSTVTARDSWSRVAKVEVREGDQILAGQVLVRFDSEPMRASLSAARADAKVAATQVPVLDSAIDETYDKERDIKSALKKINKAIGRLKSTRATLSGQLSQARRQLPQLEAQRAQTESQTDQLNEKLRQVDRQLAELRTGLAQLPPQHPSTSSPTAAPAPPNREQLVATIAQLRQARTRLQSGLKRLTGAEAQLTSALTQLRAGIPGLENAIREINDGLARAHTQRTKLRKARTKIIDARGELRRTRKLAVVAAQAATVGTQVAENQNLLATVTAPASGVVVQATTVGEVVAAGATIATIRTSAGDSLTTWLSPAQLDQVCLGSQATVHADWMTTGQRLDATITLIGDRADYPPTSFATDEVHLTRAVPVRLTLSGSAGQQQPSLPPGAPVDIEILPAANNQCSAGTTSR